MVIRRVLRIANKSLEIIMQESQTFSEKQSVKPRFRPNHQIVKSYIAEPFRT